MSQHILDRFDQIRIINLEDRSDRRREMAAELDRIGGWPANCRFYDARRPADPGGFPSLGARGCFESHLGVLRAARDANVKSLLLLEDDLDFTRAARSELGVLLNELFGKPWDFFYGAHLLPANGRRGLHELPPEQAVLTASCLAFAGRTIAPLVDFLEGIMKRPPGSPDYGPMHVDGAYGLFRLMNPQFRTFAAFPTMGYQRSSPSDITPSNMLLDRSRMTRSIATLLRRAYNLLRRHSSRGNQ